MYLVDVKRNNKPVYDARVNQAIENYLVSDLKLPGNGLMMYTNQPAVVIGRNQNVWETVNISYLHEHGFQLARRTTDSGVVFHDFGTLIFEAIITEGEKHFGDYAYYAQPILTALKGLEIDAKLEVKSGRLLFHDKVFAKLNMAQFDNTVKVSGTILYDMDFNDAKNVLNDAETHLNENTTDNPKVAEMINLGDYLPTGMTMAELRDILLKAIFDVKQLDDIEDYAINSDDWDIIDKRLADTYGTDEWNFGRNPGYDRYFTRDLVAGKMGINFSIMDDHFLRFKFNPFFPVEGDLDLVAKQLIGQTADAKGIRTAIYPGKLRNISEKELTDFILSSLQNNQGLIS